MGTPFPSHRPPGRRLFVGLFTLAFAITAGGWLSAGLAAQGQKKEEVEDTTKPKKKKPPKVDDDEPTKPTPPKGDGGGSGKPATKGGQRPKEVEEERPAPKRTVRPNDDGKPRAKNLQQVQGPPEAQTSIVEALSEAKSPELKDFYTNLKVPHDNLTVRALNDRTRTYAIEPQATYYVGEQTTFRNGYLQALTYDKEWRPSAGAMKFESALRIQPYEEIVLDDVDEFLKKDFSGADPASPRYLSRADMLRAAETVLAAADRFHASAREKGDRRGDEWTPVGQKLRARLYDIQLQRLDAFARAGDWDGASAYARTLAAAYRDPKDRGPIAKRLVDMIQDALKANSDSDHLREARQRLQFLEEVLPGSEAFRNVADGLRRQAEALVARAKELRKAEKYQEAAALTELAADIYPNLPELADEMARLNLDHPILRVAVRELPQPEHMAPGLATTDADRRAVELTYEGLVKLRGEPGRGQRYEACLAGAAPRLVPLGREFRIARGATWPDGSPVTVGDVKETLRAMRKADWPGHSPLWNAMIEDAEGGGDAFRCSLRLHQGYLDPLSLMTFKVMSQTALQNGRGGAPGGSGPYQYRSTESAARNRKAAKFLASPAYGSREGKLGLPRIREIQFIHFAESDDPVKALRDDPASQIDMVLDLSATDAASGWQGNSAFVLRGPMVTRRVHFLAINHRVGALRTNLMLRQALALAIDRQKILKECFGGEAGKVHHALNGPFPAGSWPCEKDEKKVRAELYDSDGAKAQARKAVEQNDGKPINLTLLYPDDDPATKAAMTRLCESVNQELHLDDRMFIKLTPEAVRPAMLRERVEQLHKYELAYYHYDHPSEAYWLAPLFDLAATDSYGSNYMGVQDTALMALFQQARNHRDFGQVREFMHQVHRQLVQTMPLIPLWQLDTFVAYRKGVKPTALDPIRIFNDVEHWSLEKR